MTSAAGLDLDLANALYRLLGAVDDCPDPDAITVEAIRHGWKVLAERYPSFRRIATAHDAIPAERDAGLDALVTALHVRCQATEPCSLPAGYEAAVLKAARVLRAIPVQPADPR